MLALDLGVGYGCRIKPNTNAAIFTLRLRTMCFKRVDPPNLNPSIIVDRVLQLFQALSIVFFYALLRRRHVRKFGERSSVTYFPRNLYPLTLPILK